MMHLTRITPLTSDEALITLTTTTGTSTSSVVQVLHFQLGQLAASADIVSMWEMYKINGVRVTILPQFVSPTVSATTGAENGLASFPVPYIYYCFEPVDDSSFTVAQFNGRSDIRIRRGDQRVSFYVPKPHARIQTRDDGGATNSQMTMGRNQWIRTNALNIPHYGCRLVYNVNNHAAGTQNHNVTYVWRVVLRYYISLRGVI